jgi:hypothetical protein
VTRTKQAAARLPQQAGHAPTLSAPAATTAIRKGGQSSWAMVKNILGKERNPAGKKVLELERTWDLFKDIFTDECIHFNLPHNTFYIQHAKGVIGSLPPSYRFKIGITNHPHYRFYEADYAYMKLYSKTKDGVWYSGMALLNVHYRRDWVELVEHALIVHCKEHYPRRCANRKEDYDNHIQYDSGSESDHNSQGPHFVYMSYGPKCLDTSDVDPAWTQ